MESKTESSGTAVDAPEGRDSRLIDGIYLSGGIGDSVLHMGFMLALSRHLGRRLVLINSLRDAINDLFADQPQIGRVASLRALEPAGAGRERSTHLRAFLASLGLQNLYLFSFQSEIAAAARRAGIANRYGYVRRHRFYESLLLTRSVYVSRRGTPHPDTHTWLPMLFRKLGLPDAGIYPSMFPAPEAAALAAERCRGHDRLIGIGLNASAARRRYGAGHFARVIEHLHRVRPTDSFLLFGAADVAELAQAVRSRLGQDIRVLDITAESLSLRHSFALAARCAGFISNDSAGLHLAVAAGIPTVGLFGVSPPMHYVPWLTPLTPSGPGGMDGIDPDDVARTLLKLLDLPTAAAAGART